MTANAHEPRPFHCPTCGHKHEADLSPMEGHPERHGKVHCSGCGVMLWLSLGEEGEAQCELYSARHEDPESDAAKAHRPQVFHCPACSHKHRADLSAMVGHPERHGKVHCSRCGVMLWLSLDADGLPVCELFREQASGAPKLTPAAAAAPAQAVAAPAPATKSSLPMAVVAAAVVAAIVSYLVTSATSGGSEAPQGGGDLKALERKVGDLGARFDATRDASQALNARVEAVDGELRAALDALRADVASQDQLLKDVEGLPAALAKLYETAEALGPLRDAYKSLNGRIEQNYTTLRSLAKDVQALQGK